MIESNTISFEHPWGHSTSLGKFLDRWDDNGPVKYVEIQLTNRCSLNCYSCPNRKRNGQASSVKKNQDIESELKKIIEYIEILKECGLKMVTIYGQEPLEWDKEFSNSKNAEDHLFLRRLITAVQERQILVCLATSGTELSLSFLEFLFENQVVLFMKYWGSKNSYERMIPYGAYWYERILRSLSYIDQAHNKYPEARIIAEFLYCDQTANDLHFFWQEARLRNFKPFVETPVMKNTHNRITLTPQRYVTDLYTLSIYEQSRLLGVSIKDFKESEDWKPPYGSVFPFPCDKLTRGKGLFLYHNGDIGICCGTNIILGNLNNYADCMRLKNDNFLKKVHSLYEHLDTTECGNCFYSKNLKVCYGCRGKATGMTADKNKYFNGIDPHCFGRVALSLPNDALQNIMSKPHIEIIKNCFTF